MSLITSTFAQQIRFQTSESGFKQYNFEADDVVFGYEDIAEEFEFVDYSRDISHLGFRFVMNIDMRYLRQGQPGTGSGNFGITDMINGAYSTTLGVSVLGIGMPTISVVMEPGTTAARVRRQRIQRPFSRSFYGKGKVNSIPSWLEYAKQAPGYLLI